MEPKCRGLQIAAETGGGEASELLPDGGEKSIEATGRVDERDPVIRYVVTCVCTALVILASSSTDMTCFLGACLYRLPADIDFFPSFFSASRKAPCAACAGAMPALFSGPKFAAVGLEVGRTVVLAGSHVRSWGRYSVPLLRSTSNLLGALALQSRESARHTDARTGPVVVVSATSPVRISIAPSFRT